MNKTNIVFLILFLIIFTIIIVLFSNKKEEKYDNYDFRIYFFEAGKADAILISDNGKYMMIDTGEESLSNEIISYFKVNKITELEYLIITHFEKDHVGSAASIINNINVKNVLESNYIKESIYYNNYLSALEDKGITATKVIGNYEISLNDLKIVVNGTDTLFDKNESNNSSLIVSITKNNNKFLFMADAQNQRIKEFLSNNSEHYDFVKIPYHGNYLKRLDDLLESINSKYAVLTCSNNEGCESKTIDLLNKYNIKYYLTKNGSVNVLSDGNNIVIKQ